MAKINSVFLDQGDKFPEMQLKLVSGETMKLPEATGEGYGAVSYSSIGGTGDFSAVSS